MAIPTTRARARFWRRLSRRRTSGGDKPSSSRQRAEVKKEPAGKRLLFLVPRLVASQLPGRDLEEEDRAKNESLAEPGEKEAERQKETVGGLGLFVGTAGILAEGKSIKIRPQLRPVAFGQKEDADTEELAEEKRQEVEASPGEEERLLPRMLAKKSGRSAPADEVMGEAEEVGPDHNLRTAFPRQSKKDPLLYYTLDTSSPLY